MLEMWKRESYLCVIFSSFNCLVASAGPDCTSVGVGAFTEHGPFVTNQGEAIEKNQYSWNKGATNFKKPLFLCHKLN